MAPLNVPADVVIEAGEVLIMGPHGLTASMTPEAALETARLLSMHAVDALLSRVGGKEAPVA